MAHKPDSVLTSQKIIDTNHSLNPQSCVNSRSTLDLMCDLVSDEKDCYLRAAYCVYYIGYYKPFTCCNEDTAFYLASDALKSEHGLPDNEAFRHKFDIWCNGDSPVEDIAEWLRTCKT